MIKGYFLNLTHIPTTIIKISITESEQSATDMKKN